MSVLTPYIATAFVAGIIGTTAVAFAAEASSDDAFRCELRIVDDQSTNLVVEAFVHATAGSVGEFRMSLEQQSISGKTEILQMGDFELLQKTEALLARLQISHPAAPFSMHLRVASQGQSRICTRAAT